MARGEMACLPPPVSRFLARAVSECQSRSPVVDASRNCPLSSRHRVDFLTPHQCAKYSRSHTRGDPAIMEDFYRIKRLPPYVFTIVNDLKTKARAQGEDVI